MSAMNDNFSCPDYASLGGAMGKIQAFTCKTVGAHHALAAAAIVILVIVVIALIWKQKEGFNPTQTLYMQDGDQFGGRWGGIPSRVSVWGSKEGMDSTSPGAPRFRREHATAVPLTAAQIAANAAVNSAPIDPTTSSFAQLNSTGLGTTGQFTIDPTAAAGAPGSLGYQVLNSADFDCSAVTSVPNNAWAWMTNVAESMTPYKPRTDNDMSKIMNGH